MRKNIDNFEKINFKKVILEKNVLCKLFVLKYHTNYIKNI